MPWQAGKPLTGDATVVCPLADSYVATATRETGSVAELAADRSPPSTLMWIVATAGCYRDAQSDQRLCSRISVQHLGPDFQKILGQT